MLVAFAIAAAGPVAGQDQGEFGRVIRVDPSAFAADAGLITFSERSVGTQNPLYPHSAYGAAEGSATVSFGGYFAGQRMAGPGQCPRGANRSGCIAGTPSGPLRLDPASPVAFITIDGSNPRSPSLSGSPRFNGAVSMVFDRDVAGVGLAGGFFNAVRSTAIQAYDREGRLIGGVKNIGLGMEYLALVTEDGSDRIAGVQFSLVGPEPAGYAIDDVRLGLAGQIVRDQVPGLVDGFRRVPADDNARPEARKSLADHFDRGGAGGDKSAAEDVGGAEAAEDSVPSLRSFFK